MKTMYHQAGLRTDTSVHRELKQSFDSWVKGLRSTTPSPDESHRRTGVKKPAFPQPGVYWIEGISAGRQWDEVGRWQDDGGMSTTVH